MALALVSGGTTLVSKVKSGQTLDVAADGLDVAAAGVLKLGPTTATSLELGPTVTIKSGATVGIGDATDALASLFIVGPDGQKNDLKNAASAVLSGAKALGYFPTGNFGGSVNTIQEAIDDLDGRVVSAGNTLQAKAGLLLTAGQGIAIKDDGFGAPDAVLADHSAAGVEANGLGITKLGAADNATVLIELANEVEIPDALFDGGAPTNSNGKTVWFSATTAGNFTLTKPTSTGTIAQKAGVLTKDGTGTSKIVVQVGDSVLN